MKHPFVFTTKKNLSAIDMRTVRPRNEGRNFFHFLMTRLMLIYLFLFFISSSAVSQSYQETETGVVVHCNSMQVEIQFFSNSIVRVIKWPEGTNFKKESLSVVKSPESISLDISSENDLISLQSDDLTVNLNTNNGQVSFYKNNGKALLKEKNDGAVFVEIDDAGVKSYSVSQTFGLETDEPIYGLGFQQQGRMIQRNLEMNMIQNNTESFVPFFQSVKGYGLFWDNYSPTIFSDSTEATSFNSEVGDCIDYYFMYGGNADGVVAEMRELTGQVPMFPLWTYGYWQSKERYKSQEETVGIVRKYRDLGVPLDGIIQDWQYWGSNYLWNAMEFLDVEFPDPQRFVNEVHELNAHMIITIWSSFGPKTKQYRELDAGGMLMNISTWPESGSQLWPPRLDYPSGVRVYDAYHPEARDIYWKYLNEGLFSLGIDGWWMDSTEPDHFNWQPEDFDFNTYLGSFRRVRNAYPLMTVGGVYKNQRAVTSDKRVFILTRSAFAGQQRYGANTWTGDVVASWNALRNQISAGLNFSLSGIPHWNSDIGGFFLWEYPARLDDPDYRELYARWIQFGAFCPMMRSHGAEAPREIFQFGSKGEPVYDAIEKFINLRYLLLPYIYSTSWDVTANQSSFMRALVMDFANDPKVLDIDNQYMFGKSILVCPVTEPMYTTNGREDFSTVKSSEVYLPKGTDWIDFWTGEKHSGGQTIKKQSPIDIMPLYIKAGSILPVGPKVQYATEKKWDNLEIRIYPGANGKFTLYEDEKDNYNYEEGYYSTITFYWDDANSTLTIDDRKGSFPGMLNERHFNVVKVEKGKNTGMVPMVIDRKVFYNGGKIEVKL
ncbi:glycoside hydrolase family 31 protein [Alkalitalea saponilacus]|uniref:Alpha-D-xyloside xylohydrolase n=1 Tax=Alkalitalea saponilacus TaxID=889453 RepID=A0A1T5AAE0_9BACT|nr:glycoside hydrolase family 31 protein [Alkalitalea saponilacus]SKB31876.1 alpha-D-xyloside xylohydrolase [Alkalitalea saponilacus]